jgi:hypothetical protein
VNAPPIKGPTTLARPYDAPISPLYFGLSAEGTRTAIMVYEPEKRPAAPIPHIARPMIRAVELGAAPQITLPNSKKKMDVRYVHFKGKKVYSRPQCAVVAAVVMKKAEPYQPMS